MSLGTKFSWQQGFQQQLIWSLIAEPAAATSWLLGARKLGWGWGPQHCFHLCAWPLKPLSTDQLMTENFLQW